MYMYQLLVKFEFYFHRLDDNKSFSSQVYGLQIDLQSLITGMECHIRNGQLSYVHRLDNTGTVKELPVKFK